MTKIIPEDSELFICGATKCAKDQSTLFMGAPASSAPSPNVAEDSTTTATDPSPKPAGLESIPLKLPFVLPNADTVKQVALGNYHAMLLTGAFCFLAGSN